MIVILITIIVKKRAIGGLSGILIFWDTTGEKKFKLIVLVVNHSLYLKLLPQESRVCFFDTPFTLCVMERKKKKEKK